MKANSGDLKKKVGLYYKRYQESLKANNAVDFDDLIYNTLVLFSCFPEILEQYQNRFKYIMVDEYQDTKLTANMNWSICWPPSIKIFASAATMIRVFTVGGARISIISSTLKKIMLTPRWLNWKRITARPRPFWIVNGVIARNTGRKEKALWTNNDGDEKIAIASFNQGYDEARFIVDEINDNINKGNGIFGDFAILYRTNAQSRLFEEALMRAGLPFS